MNVLPVVEEGGQDVKGAAVLSDPFVKGDVLADDTPVPSQPAVVRAREVLRPVHTEATKGGHAIRWLAQPRRDDQTIASASVRPAGATTSASMSSIVEFPDPTTTDRSWPIVEADGERKTAPRRLSAPDWCKLPVMPSPPVRVPIER